MRHDLDAREYKLLLDAARFTGSQSLHSANAFWRSDIRRIIDEKLDEAADGGSRATDEFDEVGERFVQFWDTQACLLTLSQFSLRTRTTGNCPTPSAPLDITLKLRMTDYFVVRHTVLEGAAEKAKTKFEEDIAPLEVATAPRASAVVRPLKPSVRSRYSLSVKLEDAWPEEARHTNHLQALYPALPGLVKGQYPDHETLIAGPLVRERFMKGAKVALGNGTVGEFTLTFWYLGTDETIPDVAETSFKCDLEGGDMPRRPARRALDLFNALQTDPARLVDQNLSSKTVFGLPNQCI
ncbi:hypothetical protein [Rhizobium phaseoli]|uniref:Uncharacterized protein n=1 Tax=Rhizobium phaseoli TaxID=396 RepID=A0ABM6CHV5_9HYPH|nr:hypothetical protein [Rhizobium phaseoli]ANL87889.1 hypothetical protein AMC81_PD00032 [Rhizobium phaseoli]ANL94398.1 hypothetical protein AMC80_PD00032 [Rhizobium phaseoli]RDJ03651.1 hypothetical protein B5K05_28145 [Rhizobium phaseoli]